VSRRPRDSSPKRRWLRVVIVVVVVGVVLSLGLAVWGVVSAGRSMTEPEAVRSIETVRRSSQRQTVTTTGTFAPRHAGYLSFPTPGEVTSVKVKVGDRVSKDDALATIDRADLRSAVIVAEAEVEAAQEQLDQTVKDKAGSATIAAARAGLESAQQQLRLARHNLDNATLRSSLDGVVAAVNVTAGEQSGQGSGATDPGTDPGAGAGMGPGSDPGFDPGSGMDPGGSGGPVGDTASRAAAADVVVVQPGRWIVDVAINSNDIGLIKKGQPGTVTPTGSSRTLPATVRTVGVIGSSGNGAVTFPATVTIRGKHSGLYIGGTNTVTITVKEFEDILTIPTAAISDVDGKTEVTTVVGGQDRQVPVTLGETFGSRTQVLDGLVEGDQVVYFGPPGR
jgi:multidrug efflux pump subunit AcrA (membrane-fusion protein)